MSQGSSPAAGPAVRWPRIFAALNEPNYCRYWFGLVLYVIGWRTEWVSYGWLIWELTQDPLYLGLFGLAEGVPLVLFQMFGGVMADRTSRLRLLIGTQVVTVLAVGTTFVLTALGAIRVEIALALVVVSATFRSFEQPTRMAMVPSLVGRDLLPNAIAIGSLPWQAGRVLGPSVGGLAIGLFGTTAGFGVAVASYLAAIGLYALVRLPATPATPSGGMLRPLLQGFAFVARHPLFATLILLTCFNSLFGMSFVTLLPLFADRYFEAGASGFGLLQAAVGLGAIAGTLTLASGIKQQRPRGRLLLVGLSGFGLLLMVFSQTPSLAIALPVLWLTGLSNILYLTLVNTILQEHVPNELRGRVMGLFGISFNLVSLGGLLMGAIAASTGARTAVLLGGAVVLVGALMSLALNHRLRAVS